MSNRLSSTDVNKFLDLMPRFQNYLDAEKASVSVGVSIQDITVHPTALEARIPVKITGDPRDTVIGSYGTRNGTGTNAGTHYTATNGKFIFQPGDPLIKEIVIPLRGNNTVGNTIEVVISNTLYGAYRIGSDIIRIRFSTTVPVSQDIWRLVYETDFIDGFEATDSGRDANGQVCWSSRLAHGRTQPSNAELGLYADPVVIPGTNPFPIVNGKRVLRSEQITNVWQGKTYNYTAALIRSNMLQLVTDGMKVEARFALPSTPARGAWPAFWLLPTDGSWPPEIDVLEWAVNSSANPWTMNSTQHWQELSVNKNRSYAIDIRNFGATEDLTKLHTWGIELSEGNLYYTLDGVRFITMEHRSPGKTWYVLLNIAMGGTWPGSPTTSTVFPCDMVLDWIKFYEPV